MWINAFKDNGNRYTAGEIRSLEEVDPYFSLNIPDYESLGKSCQAGSQVFYVQAQARSSAATRTARLSATCTATGWRDYHRSGLAA